MAAGRNLTARFVLTLRDGVSSGLGALRSRLDRLQQAGRRIGLLGAAVAAISFAGPIASAAAFQDTLLQAQITAGGVGAAAMLAAAEAGRAYEVLALQTGQRSREIADAAQNLIAAGLSGDDVATFLPILARTATAAGATMADLSRAMVAMRQNAGISGATEMADALGGMAQAGKAGNFEMRDMARFFPSLLAQMDGLGVRGRTATDSLASMLQVARQGAGSTEEAANNLTNFLSKLTSPETRRNFQAIGVNLEGVLADAARQGINPVEAVLQKIRERTGGNMFRVGELFGDMQILNFLRPMLRGTAEYLSILEEVRRANASLVDQDFATRMLGAQMQLNIVMERGEQIMRRIGLGAAASLGPMNVALTGVMAGISWMDATFPGLIDQTIGWGASLVVLAAALAAAVPVLGFLLTGFQLLATPMRLLLVPLRAVTAGLVALGAPIGIAVAAVAVLAVGLIAAAINIWRNWDRFAGFFTTMWAGIRAVFWGFIEFVAGVFTADSRRIMAGLSAIWGGLGDFFPGLWGVVRQSFIDFGAWVDGWTGGAMTATLAGITGLWTTIRDGVVRIATDLGQVANEMLAPIFTALWKNIGDTFGDLLPDLGGKLRGFVADVVAFLAPLEALLNRIAAATEPSGSNPAFSPEAQAERRQRGGSAGRAAAASGTYAPSAALPGSAPPQELRGRIVIETQPGTTVREAEIDLPGVSFEGSRGAVLGRP
ncbi:phage tail tape measure protein [Falsiroseomonas sp.]|uniref:phage tail tape measure protein n=1 Tax=Falsiroseomonas sp. TaxID=2870721 RepID=UPI0027219397|nr:phage tail tape measure protein [Falsiroseomonas sp.]MDO9501386.1 phage tail tape measure protein [Falsiroseomonas sp.]